MTTATINENTWVSDIVSEMPRTGDLFRELRIDFCCGGKMPLQQAAQERGLDTAEVLSRIEDIAREEAQRQDMKPSSLEPEALIAHIQRKYHEALREELPALTPYVTKLARVHGGHRPYLLRVQEIFSLLKKDLLEHTEDEDRNVFPLLTRYFASPSAETAEALKPHLSELETEHEAAGDLLKELREITSDFVPPMDACGTHRLVLNRLEALEKDTFEHIHLENNVLFDQARKAI
ncbi:iron-sulfur cluster repair di-iron protein [Saccharibacillus sp. CPCC 101409]|uniref:iron-sulfur cluster repair di-iron protein n=1 Tax=Saccharibacillus sp. CPCC 101409 TaxID=3058041 RepID=UPI0026737DFD|nr:iron-sulfur cluster repair di-iron protein [Saccharibacillus sp. CPCC 101409]MDO3413252.1 iron-sulfur cluster repair di-iron protein [Saccharibacillus sp. CPCC 101409]